MMCYKDRTFCASDCTNKDCFRFLPDEERNKAAAAGFLFSFADFSENCDAYVPGVKE